MYSDPKKARAYAARYRSLHREALNETKRADYRKDRERILNRSKQYQEANRAEILEKKRALHKKDGDRHRAAMRAYYAANRDEIKKKRKLARARDKDAIRARNRNRKAKQRLAAGSHTAADIADILSKQKRKCAHCRRPVVKSGYHVDHIIPLSRGGANHRRNLQILCRECNLRKHAKDPLGFARQEGLLI